MLFFSTWLGSYKIDLFCCRPCFKNRAKLEKLYNEAADKFDEETDVVKITKDLRDLETLIKSFIMDD